MARIRESGGAEATLSRLRRDIARLEGRFDGALAETGVRAGRPWVVGGGADDPVSPDGREARHGCGPAVAGAARDDGLIRFGVPRVDTLVGGGLLRAALHDVRAMEARDGAAAAGFVLALLARSRAGGQRNGGGRDAAALLWISAGDAAQEAGGLYAPGLAALGFDPARVVRVRVDRTGDALWALEAALACRGVAHAVCEIRRGGDDIDLTTSRRLALRARTHGVTGFLLRLSGNSAGAGATPSAADTRWRVRPAPSGALGLLADGVGRAAWRLTLEKSRRGRAGDAVLEWDPGRCRFVERAATAAALSEPSSVGSSSAGPEIVAGHAVVAR